MAYLKMNRAADSGLFVVESLRQYKDTVHARLSEIWHELRPEEPPPSFDVLIDVMAEDLNKATVKMVEDLDRYLLESKVDEAGRTERLNAVKELRSWYQYVRDHCVNTYGVETAKEMGFDLQTEENPWRLARQANRAIGVFEGLDPDEKMPPDDPKKAEAALRPGYVLELLKAPHRRLTKALGKLLTETRGTEKTLIRKNAAYATYAQKFSIFARLSEGLYRWAGLEEEAKRIRPSTRRPGLRQEIDDSEAADAGSEPSVDDPDNSPGSETGVP